MAITDSDVQRAIGHFAGPHTRPQAPRPAAGYPSVPQQSAAGTAPSSSRPPAGSERLLSLRPSADLRDALAGIAWLNSLSRADRAHWLDAAGSAVPADAWAVFKRARSGAAEVQS